jgi:CheY-like chemotaxis protein
MAAHDDIMGNKNARRAGGWPQAIALALSWQPEFILLDIALPAIDGYAVAARLRQEKAC